VFYRWIGKTGELLIALVLLGFFSVHTVAGAGPQNGDLDALNGLVGQLPDPQAPIVSWQPASMLLPPGTTQVDL
jgi:hypothetical protein